MEATSPKRTIVITGAGSGIGRSCVQRLATAETFILALDRDLNAAKETMKSLEAAGFAGSAVACDVTNQESIDAAFQTLTSADVLVNSAGVEDEKALKDITSADMRRMYDINVVGLFSVTMAALTRMPNGGSIVNIGSRAYLGSPNHAHYVASKAAAVGLTRTMALELKSRQIAVNLVAPGPVMTPLLAGRSKDELAKLAAEYPGGRLPEPEDVARAVAFFADPKTRYITGQVLLLDGGRSLGGSAS